MALVYNADELFEIAEQIERNGAKFYRQAAEATKDTLSSEILLSLAAWEDQHEKLFAKMREELSKEDRESAFLDRDNQAALYLQAAADSHIFNVNDISGMLKGTETAEEILRVALSFEKDSVVFFLAMKQLIPESLGKDKISGILDEEMDHVAIVTSHIKRLQDG